MWNYLRSWISPRFIEWKAILSSPWRWAVIAIFAVLGAYQTVQQQWFPTLPVSLHFPPWIWFIIAIIVFFAILEGAYRRIRTVRKLVEDREAVIIKERDEARNLYKPIEELVNIKSGDVITGKDINISLMFQKLNSNPQRKGEEHNILDNVTFDHCELRGPCGVILIGEWEFRQVKLFGHGTIRASRVLKNR